MKTIRLWIIGGCLLAMASCGNPGQQQNNSDTPPLSDSVGQDTATWGDTTRTTDSLGSPSFP